MYSHFYTGADPSRKAWIVYQNIITK